MPIVPGHGRDLPSGRNIAEAIQALWRQQAQRFARTGDPDSIRFDETEMAALQRFFAALLGPLWRQAWLEALYRIRLSAMNAGRAPVQTEIRAYRGVVEISAGPITKDLTRFALGFDIYNEEITAFIEQQTYHFLTSVNDTTSELLRVTMFLTESEGWTPLERTRKVQELFSDPERSFTIANSEASRATHGGQYQAEKKTGLVDRKKWLASSDACPRCLKIAARGAIPFDEPFEVNGTGPYAVSMFPPCHPNDMCSYIGLLAMGQPEE